MSNHAKDLRSQLRNIVKEVLPTFIADGMGYEIQKRLESTILAHNAQRMDAIEKHVKDQLEQIAARQKEVTELLKQTIKAHSKPASDEGSSNE